MEGESRQPVVTGCRRLLTPGSKKFACFHVFNIVTLKDVAFYVGFG